VKRSRFLLYLIPALMAVVVLPAVGSTDLDGEQIDVPNRIIVVGTALDYPPYSFLDDDGNPAGFNVELTQAIARVMELNIEIKIGPWSKIREALESGKIDAISGMYYSDERDGLVDFSPAYTTVHHAIFTRRDSPKIKSEQALRHRNIIVVRDDIMHDYVLSKDLSENPVPVETQADALRLLALGQHDCALIAKLPGLYWMKELGLSNIRSSGHVLDSKYCYAVKEGNTALLSHFDQGLAIIKETGQYDQIYDKWLGVLEPRGIPKGVILKYAILVLLPSLLLIGLSVLWSRTLKKRVAQRTTELQREINEHKQAEEKIKNLAKFPAENPNPILKISRDGTILYANDASAPLLETWGCQIGERLPQPCFKRAEQAFRLDKPCAFEFNCYDRIFLVTLAPVAEFDYVNAYGLDITKSKQAEEELLLKTVLLEAQSETSLDGILVVDDKGNSLLFNRRFGEMWNIPQEILDSRDDEKILQYVLDQLKDPDGFLEKVKYLYVNKDEKSRDEIRFKDGKAFDRYSSPLVDANGKYYGRIWYFRDITERKRAEEEQAQLQEELFQAQKLKSIGMLAGGIAHDFNNLLQGILGYVQLMKVRMDEDDPNYAELNLIEVVAEKAAHLTQQLLSYARKGKYIVGPIKIEKAVNQVVSLLDRTIDKNIVINYEVPLDIPNINADENQIYQMLLNICVNAKDAMPDGGKLTISAEEANIDDVYCRSQPEAKPGRHVCLRIRDTGTGMDEITQAKIFEPFYTTKEVGKGTGLGLSMVFGIVESHGGFIEVESALGQGTEFRIFLPAAVSGSVPEEVESTISESLIDTQPSHIEKEKCVLVVDDEEIVRYLAIDLLTNLGYETLPAVNGQEAVEVFDKQSDNIDLVLLDMVMPKMGGVETFRRLRKIDPQVPIVLLSGYSKDEAAQKLINEGASGFIQKPYKL